MGPTAGAVLALLQPLRVVSAVLASGVVSLPAVGALQGNQDTGFAAFSSHFLFSHAGDDPCAHGAASLSDGEVKALFHGDGVNEADFHGGVVTGHHHFHTLVQPDLTGNVAGADEELGLVAGEEGGVPAALLLAEDVDFGLGLGVGLNGAGVGEDFTSLDIRAVNASEENAYGVAGFGLVQGFVEHLQAGGDGLGDLAEADNFHRVAGADGPTLDAAGDDGCHVP